MSKGKSTIDQDLIRELAKLLEETGLSELEVEQEGTRIRVARGGRAVAAAAAPAPAAHPAAAAPAPAADDDLSKHPGVVTSPMVGTAYLSSEPGSAPFVKVGDRVDTGQTLLIIEAMKVMNPIAAPHDGTVTEILVQDGRPVEYDEVLMVIQ